MSTQLSWEWFGGFFDGEGCIATIKQNGKSDVIAIRLSVSQYGEQSFIIADIQRWLSRQGVRGYVRPTGIDIQWDKFDDVAWLLENLIPHLRVKKQRAQECLRYMRHVSKLREDHGIRFWPQFVNAALVPKALRA